MLSKRIVAISADKAFSKRRSAGLQAAGGMVECVASPDDLAKGEIGADLVVVHMLENGAAMTAAVAARIKKEGSLIVVIAASSLEQVVYAMKIPRVTAVLVADEMTQASLAAVASRALYGDVFGLEKIVPWGVKVYSHLVGDYQEKSVAIAAVADFAQAMGVRRKYRESVEQCLDEMLMNALYDAPVDSAGKQMFADVPTKTRISLRMEQKAIVQYACDGNMFAMSVRDSFGALKGETVVKYLDKCLHAAQQIDRKAGGAGLGLYIISSSSTQFLVNLYPGVATEAICTFDLNAPKVQLKEFGIFSERIDAAGRLAAGPSRLHGGGGAGGRTTGSTEAVGPSSRGLMVALGAAILFICALIAIVAYPRWVEKPKGALAITTTPPGATIEIDGRAVGASGQAPLAVHDLIVGQKYKVTARLPGFEPGEAIVEPAKNQDAPVAITLKALSPVVTIDSDPRGATVVIAGVERGVTPVTLTDLTPGADAVVTLRRTGYGDEQMTVHAPPAGEHVSVSRALSMASKFGSLRLESDPPGADVYEDDHLIAGKPTPIAEEIVESGKPIRITMKLTGYQPDTRTVTIAAGDSKTIKATLKPGGAVSVNVNVPEAKWSVDGSKTCVDLDSGASCSLADGRYKVTVSSRSPHVDEKYDVEIKGAEVTRDVKLGVVEVDGPDVEMRLPGAPHVRQAAMSEGRHVVIVVNTRTNEQARRAITVSAATPTRVGLK